MLDPPTPPSPLADSPLAMRFLIVLVALLTSSIALAQTQTITSTYPDGSKREESRLVEGQPHGLVKFWHQNGQLQTLGQMRAGKQYGLWQQWNADGQLIYVRNYRNGLYHGDVITYSESGEVARKERYEMGRIVGERYEAIDYGKGLRVTRTQYKDGLLHGSHKVTEAGKLLQSGEHILGLKVGKWKFQHDGKSGFEIHDYVDGMLVRSCSGPRGQKQCKEHAPYRRIANACVPSKQTHPVDRNEAAIHELDSQSLTETFKGCRENLHVDWSKYKVWTFYYFGRERAGSLTRVEAKGNAYTLVFSKYVGCSGGFKMPKFWQQVTVVLPKAAKPKAVVNTEAAKCGGKPRP